MRAWFRKVAQQFQKKKEPEVSLEQWWLRLYPLLKIRVDVDKLMALSEPDEREKFLRHNIQAVQTELHLKLTPDIHDFIVMRWTWEIWGFGPLEPLLANPEITDILINGPREIFKEVHGLLEGTEHHFDDVPHLMNHVYRVLSDQGHRVDYAAPYVDSKLKDGSRLNVVVSPIAPDGPVVAIRKFVHDKMSLEDLQQAGSMPKVVQRYLQMIIQARLNIILSGATGSGKTTLLNALLSGIPKIERLVVIEDTAELALENRHAVRLLTRVESAMGTLQVTQRDLLKNALRMRPDRILIGEVRGDEVMEMFQAMNTGHDGSLSTIHASYVEEVPTRLANLASMTELSLTTEFIMKQIAASLDVIVQIGRYPDGRRRLAQVSEVMGFQEGVIQFADVYRLTYNEQQRDWVPHFDPLQIQQSTIVKARERGVDEEIIEEVLRG